MRRRGVRELSALSKPCSMQPINKIHTPRLPRAIFREDVHKKVHPLFYICPAKKMKGAKSMKKLMSARFL